MKKYALVIAAAAGAFTLSTGVAHADALSNAINAQSAIPGMVTFLNVLRSNGALTAANEVSEGVYMGQHYCNPTPQDLVWFGVGTPDEYRDFVRDVVVGETLPPANAARVDTALDVLCTAH